MDLKNPEDSFIFIVSTGVVFMSADLSVSGQYGITLRYPCEQLLLQSPRPRDMLFVLRYLIYRG